MAKSIWTILNIPSSSDERTIKRAYASLLRANNPEDDPAGFQVLRGAYEQAIQYAKYAKDYPDQAYYDDWEDEDEDEAEEPDSQLTVQAAPSSARDGDVLQNDPLAPSPIERPLPQNPPRQPSSPELTPQQRDHQDKLAVLDEAVQRGAPAIELEAALQAVVNSPAIVDIGIYTQTEQHILDLISTNSEAARSICDSAFEAFGWDKAENQGRGSIGQQAVWIRDSWRQDTQSVEFLARVKNPKHEFYPAWREASIDPATRSAFSKIAGLRHLPVVQRFFNAIYEKAPSLFDDLNHDAVAWLDDRLLRYLPKFRFIKWGFIGLVVLGVIAAFTLDPAPPAGGSSGSQQPPRASTDVGSPAGTRARC